LFAANMYVIRRSNESDADALRRLADVGGHTPLSGDVLVAEKDGKIAAAISLSDGRSVADGVRRIPDAVTLLRLRAGTLRAIERTPSLSRRLLAAIRVRPVAPAPAT
jgi:hypothetical protein